MMLNGNIILDRIYKFDRIFKVRFENRNLDFMSVGINYKGL